MIAIKPQDVNTSDHPMVDIGRPSFFNEEEATIWKEFHSWIVETEVPIYVNGAFHVVKDMLDEGTFYGGNGFKYCFWFNNEEDKAAFKRFMVEWEKKWNALMLKERKEREEKAHVQHQRE